MNSEDHVCVCHKVSLRKLESYLKRENPKVASQLSECLDSGTACGWCVPFLKKLHTQYVEGDPLQLSVDHERYLDRRKAFTQRKTDRDGKNG